MKLFTKRMITFSVVTDKSEINFLRGVKSQVGDFIYGYGDESSAEDETLNLLRKNFSREHSLYLIAKDSNEFAGFCSMDTEWWEEKYFFLREIFVNPQFQKRGVGDEFIKLCIQHARTKGFKGVVTETAFENKPMQKLCERSGFKKWENPEWKDGITYKISF